MTEDGIDEAAVEAALRAVLGENWPHVSQAAMLAFRTASGTTWWVREGRYQRVGRDVEDVPTLTDDGALTPHDWHPFDAARFDKNRWGWAFRAWPATRRGIVSGGIESGPIVEVAADS